MVAGMVWGVGPFASFEDIMGVPLAVSDTINDNLEDIIGTGSEPMPEPEPVNQTVEPIPDKIVIETDVFETGDLFEDDLI